MTRRAPATVRRAREIAVNLWLTAATVVHHVGEDPVVFCLQLSRRLPRRWVVPAARLVSRLPGGRAVPARATALHVLGRDDAARALLHDAPAAWPPAARRRAAEVALATGDPGLAETLLEPLPRGSRGAAATRARLAWHRGDVDGAVEVLRHAEHAGTATRGERALHLRLSAERDLLGDFTPHLDPVPGYQPRERTLLYAVTNSLPHTGSGYAQRTHSCATALRDRGWDVHAATRPGYPVQVGRILAPHTDTVDGIPYHRILPAHLAPTATGRVQQHAEALLRLALQIRPAALHTTSHHVNALAVRAVAEALGIPWVYEVRGLLADTWAATRGPEALVSARYERFQRREAQAVAAADRTVTLGTAMAERITALTAALDPEAPPPRVDLAPNGVGRDYLRAVPTRHDARAALGLDPHHLIIGTVSSLVDYEGLDDLLRAAALLAPPLAALRVRITGDGVARPALERLARDLGLTAAVAFTGRVDRAHAPVHAAALDIFLIPRKDRTVTRTVTPLKPVEAMAAGATVIASDLPALRESVHHEHTGLLTPPEDPAALAAAVRRLASRPDDAARLARAGRQWAHTHRTWDAVARDADARYCDLIRSVPHTAHTREENSA
ncbi:glycosyltransferase [Kocuria rhizophila]|uniref:glycosyltransferase n=1 Tax=Kocuria rhizophila TaxID=72000 RepID=UPI00190DBFC9|nr:glycosyltransferase [Kocuria rhizophila]MBK4120369.1 glycosyltransferase [Kocuria rhizophila]